MQGRLEGRMMIEKQEREDRPVVAVVLKSSLMIFSSMSSSSWEEERDTEREAGCSRNVCWEHTQYCGVTHHTTTQHVCALLTTTASCVYVCASIY